MNWSVHSPVCDWEENDLRDTEMWKGQVRRSHEHCDALTSCMENWFMVFNSGCQGDWVQKLWLWLDTFWRVITWLDIKVPGEYFWSPFLIQGCRSHLGNPLPERCTYTLCFSDSQCFVPDLRVCISTHMCLFWPTSGEPVGHLLWLLESRQVSMALRRVCSRNLGFVLHHGSQEKNYGMSWNSTLNSGI